MPGRFLCLLTTPYLTLPHGFLFAVGIAVDTPHSSISWVCLATTGRTRWLGCSCSATLAGHLASSCSSDAAR